MVIYNIIRVRIIKYCSTELLTVRVMLRDVCVHRIKHKQLVKTKSFVIKSDALVILLSFKPVLCSLNVIVKMVDVSYFVDRM
jgi:hypothetical protein